MSQNSREELAQICVNLKAQQTELQRQIAAMAFVFTEHNDAGGMASLLITGTARIKVWAKVYEIFGPDAIADIAPLDVEWWKNILKCPDPAEALEEALQLEMTTAQIKKQWNLVNHRPSALYSGAATLEEATAGKLAAWLDDTEATLEKRRCYITVKAIEEGE